MQPKKTIIALIIAFGSIFFLTNCYKDKTVILDGPEITRTVTFSQDILPIFSKSCSLSGCHSSGGQSPDLSESNAFSSLTIGNYFDTNTPESSFIYLKMTGKKGNPMPVGGSNQDYNALILAWIKQGAKND